jgi:hypothetical protein
MADKTVFVVPQYLDQIKEKTVAQADRADSFWSEANKANRDPRFFTLEDASCYIISRASRKVEDAAKALVAAEKRLAKCQKKFGRQRKDQ